MNLELKRVVLLLLIFSSYAASAQVIGPIEGSTTEPVTYDKFHVEISAGASISKLPIRIYRDERALINPYGDIAVIVPIKSRWRVRAGINYIVIGNSSKLLGSISKNATANRKLPYIGIYIQTGYLISNPINRLQVELQGGFFGAKKLDDVTITRQPDLPEPVSRAKSIDSSVDNNYGIISGISLSTRINRRNRLGVKFLYHQGLFDIRTPYSKQNTGETPTVTQAFSLCTFISI